MYLLYNVCVYIDRCMIDVYIVSLLSSLLSPLDMPPKSRPAHQQATHSLLDWHDPLCCLTTRNPCNLRGVVTMFALAPPQCHTDICGCIWRKHRLHLSSPELVYT
jgi:hypothetical protein